MWHCPFQETNASKLEYPSLTKTTFLSHLATDKTLRWAGATFQEWWCSGKRNLYYGEGGDK